MLDARRYERVALVLTASEIAEFTYCPQSWWLRRSGALGSALGEFRRYEGVELHRTLGARTDHLRDSQASSRLLRTAALVLASAAALLAVLFLSPHASAAPAGEVASEPAAFAQPLILVVVAASALAWAMSRTLDRRANHLRREIGLRSGDQVLAADDSRLGSRTFVARDLGLVARPDHLVRLADGATIPIEQKPRARRVYRSHVLEIGAQLVAIDACSGRRPPYGVLVVGGGERHEVQFERRLEEDVLETMDAMRGFMRRDAAPGRRWLGAKCRACEFHNLCWG